MLHIPTPVVTGDSVRLRCGYELGNETLYAVKWYKNMGEFFRYVPGSEPPLKTFPQAGIDVDVSKNFRIRFILSFLQLMYKVHFKSILTQINSMTTSSSFLFSPQNDSTAKEFTLYTELLYTVNYYSTERVSRVF